MGEENNEKKRRSHASHRGTQQRMRQSPWESESSTLEQYFSYWIHWEIQRNKTPGIEHDIFDNTPPTLIAPSSTSLTIFS